MAASKSAVWALSVHHKPRPWRTRGEAEAPDAKYAAARQRLHVVTRRLISGAARVTQSSAKRLSKPQKKRRISVPLLNRNLWLCAQAHENYLMRLDNLCARYGTEQQNPRKMLFSVWHLNKMCDRQTKDCEQAAEALRSLAASPAVAKSMRQMPRDFRDVIFDTHDGSPLLIDHNGRKRLTAKTKRCLSLWSRAVAAARDDDDDGSESGPDEDAVDVWNELVVNASVVQPGTPSAPSSSDSAAATTHHRMTPARRSPTGQRKSAAQQTPKTAPSTQRVLTSLRSTPRRSPRISAAAPMTG